MLIYSAAIGILLGIIGSFLVGAHSLFALFVLILGMGFGAAGFLLNRQWYFVLALLCAACALGIVRTEFFLAWEAARNLAPYAGDERTIEGVITNDPERRETSVYVYLDVQTIDGEEARGTLLATLPREVRVEVGDTLTLKGTLSAPEAFETNTGRLFNYPGYLRVRYVSAVMRYALIENVVEGSISLRKILYALKHSFEYSLRQVLPEPNTSLMEGILLGERRGIPEDLNRSLIVVGLIHIVVLSGYNISIVAEQALRFFSLFFSRKLAFMVGAGAIVLFALMVGAGATVVRASVMGIVAIIARVMERPSAALRALAFAAVAMALWNPTVVLYDPSFILSVLATFGLVTLSNSVEKRITKIPERGGLRSIIASTIAVQIYILPALLYMTGMLSPFALIGNALVLPLVPLVMLFGFAAGLVGFVHSMLALPFAILAHALLVWVTSVAGAIASLPFSSATVMPFPIWVAVLVYIPLTGAALWLYNKEGSTRFRLPESASQPRSS